MKIYAFIFLLTCCTFQQSHTSSLNWKEIILIRQQIREIKSIIDKVLLPLKIVTYKKGTLEAYSCYKDAEWQLSGVQKIGYADVTDCIKDSSKGLAAGIGCAKNAQEIVRESSRSISTEAIQCLNVTSEPTTPNSTSEEILYLE